MARFDREASTGGDFEQVPAGRVLAQYSEFATDWREDDEGHMYVIAHYGILEAGDETDQSAVGMDLPWRFQDPTVTFGDASLSMLLARHGLSLEGAPLDDLDNLTKIIDVALKKTDPLWVVVSESGWPSFYPVPEGDYLAVFHGFQYFDVYKGVPVWKREEREWKGKTRIQYATPAMFRIIYGEYLNHVIRYPWLNYTIGRTVDENSGEYVFTGGGANAKFPPFCSKIGVDLTTEIEEDANGAYEKALYEEDGSEEWRPNILPLIEATAFARVEEGHVLKLGMIKKKDAVVLDLDSLMGATKADIKRVSGSVDVDIPKLVPIMEFIGGEKKVSRSAWSPDVYQRSLNERMSAILDKKVVVAEQLAIRVDAKEIAKQYMLPIYNVLGLDRAKPFRITEDQSGMVLTLLNHDEYVKVAGTGDSDAAEAVVKSFLEFLAEGDESEEHISTDESGF